MVIKYRPHLVHSNPLFGSNASPSIPQKAGTTEKAMKNTDMVSSGWSSENGFSASTHFGDS
jgi:hypothetical protein